MEAQKDDCYYFYYSTCTKGDSCPFRHEPAALGSEKVCNLWEDGRCFREVCYFRHMKIRKDRGTIPCYWQLQPGGCCKPHCVFQHNTPTNDDGQKAIDEPDGWAAGPSVPVAPQQSVVSINPHLNPSFNQPSAHSYYLPAVHQVQQVVINPFEEESDQESIPMSTPIKSRLSATEEAPHINRTQEQNVHSGHSAAPKESRQSPDKHVTTSEPEKLPLSKGKQEESTKGDLGIKSLEEITREKALKSLRSRQKLKAEETKARDLPTHSSLRQPSPEPHLFESHRILLRTDNTTSDVSPKKCSNLKERLGRQSVIVSKKPREHPKSCDLRDRLGKQSVTTRPQEHSVKNRLGKKPDRDPTQETTIENDKTNSENKNRRRLHREELKHKMEIQSDEGELFEDKRLIRIPKSDNVMSYEWIPGDVEEVEGLPYSQVTDSDTEVIDEDDLPVAVKSQRRTHKEKTCIHRKDTKTDSETEKVKAEKDIPDVAVKSQRRSHKHKIIKLRRNTKIVTDREAETIKAKEDGEVNSQKTTHKQKILQARSDVKTVTDSDTEEVIPVDIKSQRHIHKEKSLKFRKTTKTGETQLVIKEGTGEDKDSTPHTELVITRITVNPDSFDKINIKSLSEIHKAKKRCIPVVQSVEELPRKPLLSVEKPKQRTSLSTERMSDNSIKKKRPRMEIYQPPALKRKVVEEPVRLEEKKTRTRDKKSCRLYDNKEVEEEIANIPAQKKKPSGWGVMTFSEIMQEKRLKRQQEQKEKKTDNERQTHKHTIAPITFASGKQDLKTHKKPRFCPVTFGDESGKKKDLQPTNSRATSSPVIYDEIDIFGLAENTKETFSTALNDKSKITDVFVSRPLTNPPGNDSKMEKRTKHVLVPASIQTESNLQTPANDSSFDVIPTRINRKRRGSQGRSSQSSVCTASPKSTQETTRPKLTRDDTLDFLEAEIDDILDNAKNLDGSLHSEHNSTADDDLLMEMEELLA